MIQVDRDLPDKRSAVEQSLNLTSTQKEIRAHLEQGGVRWIPLADFFGDEYDSCVDGRDVEYIVGTPGGDMGRLLTEIAVAEKMLERTFTEEEVSAIFERYVESFGRFYMHTDHHALEHIAEILNSEHSDLFGDVNPHHMEELIRNATPEQQPVLLALLSDPALIGCGHLRLALQHAEEYGAREEVTRQLIQAFYLMLWQDPDKVQWVILEGGHAEKLVLNIHVEGEITDDTLIPAVKPCTEATEGGESNDEFFINHPEVVDAIRERTAREISRQGIIPGITEENADDFVSMVKGLGGTQLGKTLGYLAPTLEVWDVTIRQDDQGETVIDTPVSA